MDHFINIPVDHTGVIPDPELAIAVGDVMASPFDFTDIFIYVHGWWTSNTDSMCEYSRFSISFLRTLSQMDHACFSTSPLSSLGVGIHWPSVLSQDAYQAINIFEPLSFYQMERRSDDVGMNAVYALLRILFMGRRQRDPQRRFRLTLIGHSFGCRVLCRALARLEQTLSDGSTDDACREFVLASRINLVLLQAAVESSELDENRCFGRLAGLPMLRILVSNSKLDFALGNLFPLAEKMNILSLQPGTRLALGFAGPTEQTVRRYGASKLAIAPGWDECAQLQLPNRLVVADLTELHKASSYPAQPLRGHHSDIFHPEIYRLIASFSFNA